MCIRDSRKARDVAQAAFDLSFAGLKRRARRSKDGHDEGVHLEPLRALFDRGQCPADVLLSGLKAGDAVPVAELVRRTRI